jgi:hypothetical protein
LVIFYDGKVDYCKVTANDSEMTPMMRTTKSEFDMIRANKGWQQLKDKQKEKEVVNLFKIKGQSLQICAIYCGDNVQWATMIGDISQNWSTTLRTTFEDQWGDNLEEDYNTAFSMFDGNIE